MSLTLQHGKAPKGASYEYAVLPHTDAAALEAFAKKPTYKILQQDRNAHIVRSPADGLTSYVLFETPQALPDGGLLQKADTSCLVMIREYKDKLLLTVSQPTWPCIVVRVTRLSIKTENVLSAVSIHARGLTMRVRRFP